MSAARTDPARQRAERRGRLAEFAAAVLLMLKFYRIIGWRVKTPKGEIDLIAKRGDTVAFVEVKARSGHDQALLSVTPRQARRIVDAAQVWLGQNGAFQQCNCRFDIITVSPYLWPRHTENAFDADL